MNIEKFKKIENELNQSFDKKYSGLRNLLYYSSIFGNAMSILLAFFFLSKLLIESVSYLNVYILYSVSFLILLGLELFKRSLFTKFSLEFVNNKYSLIKKETFILFISSLLVITFSFYSSLKGAKEFTSKESMIESNIKTNNNLFSDSINKIYSPKILDIETDIKSIKSKIEIKDKEQTDISSFEKINKNQLQRIKDIKLEKESLKSDIEKNFVIIDNLKNEKDSIIKVNFDNIKLTSEKDKDKNNGNSITFIIISMIIELLILVGIYFDKIYKYISYTDHKHKINNDTNYQKWLLYDSVLDIVFLNKGFGEKINSIQSILDTCKTNNIIINRNEMVDLLKLLTTLKTLKLSGPNRTILKDYETSKEELKKNFNVE